MPAADTAHCRWVSRPDEHSRLARVGIRGAGRDRGRQRHRGHAADVRALLRGRRHMDVERHENRVALVAVHAAQVHRRRGQVAGVVKRRVAGQEGGVQRVDVGLGELDVEVVAVVSGGIAVAGPRPLRVGRQVVEPAPVRERRGGRARPPRRASVRSTPAAGGRGRAW